MSSPPMAGWSDDMACDNCRQLGRICYCYRITEPHHATTTDQPAQIPEGD